MLLKSVVAMEVVTRVVVYFMFIVLVFILSAPPSALKRCCLGDGTVSKLQKDMGFCFQNML